MSIPPSLAERIGKAEASLAALARELAAIRSEVAALSRESAPATRSVEQPRAQASAPRPDAIPRRIFEGNTLDFERLIGRYGMLGIAVIAAIAAVGTFLSWAISHGYLTLNPAARVLVGLAFAAGIGTWGLKLRRREKSFGSSVVGLALVIVLVCAYAAGPGFHLVPAWVAFGGSAAIAWGLALFARGQDDEPLWCVAFGGAAIAPFATSDNSGNLYGLLAYGLFLLLAACFAISHRSWPVAWRVFYAASALFVASTTWMARDHGMPGVVATFAFPLVIGAAGILPFAPDSKKRAALRWLAILALLVSFDFEGRWVSGAAWTLMAAVLLATGLWLFIIDRLRGVAQSSLLARNARRGPMLDWVDGALIPVFFTLQAASIAPSDTATSLAYGVVAVMLFAAVWRHELGTPRAATAMALMIAATGLLIESLPSEPIALIPAFLGLALFALVMHRLRPSLSWVVGGGIALAAAATWNIESLTERARYLSPPFLTTPSFTALLMTAALAIIARFWRWLFDATCAMMGDQARRKYSDSVRMLVHIAIGAPWVWAFIWVFIELAMAYSASMSTLLLVTYFAATAVGSVAVGRMRHSALLRRIGLGLAVAAAATSAYGAGTYFDIGIRIVAYLVTSAFLLGIAYWYRRPGAATANV